MARPTTTRMRRSDCDRNSSGGRPAAVRNHEPHHRAARHASRRTDPDQDAGGLCPLVLVSAAHVAEADGSLRAVSGDGPLCDSATCR